MNKRSSLLSRAEQDPEEAHMSPLCVHSLPPPPLPTLIPVHTSASSWQHNPCGPVSGSATRTRFQVHVLPGISPAPWQGHGLHHVL